jgi:phage shock protein C
VCKGLANYLDVSVFWLRVIVVLVTLFTGIGLPLMLILYIVAVLLIKPAPPATLAGPDERAFYDECVTTRGATVERMRRSFESLDRRIRRMEGIVTSPDFQWDQRMKQ